ncbi:major facilitator superfamily domain-containing protein 6-like [Rhopilema esculentum]|uniref:major facilitator superfamily domain-containing protein 6-like n=1 Tax=Rhopilema esculentum TaxID=499914 RepID=UPI0031DBA572|eukprot:gene14717-5815_t
MSFPSSNFRQSVNFDLLKAKIFYFCFVSGMMTLLPYLYLYYKHVLFLSPFQVTILVAIRPLCLIIGAPILGTIADKTNNFKTTILICLGGYIATYGLVTLIKPVDGFNCQDLITARAAQNSNITSINNRSKEFKFLQALNQRKEYFYPGRLMEDSLYSWPFSMNEYEKTEQITEGLFFTVLGITAAGELISSPAYTFADVYTLQMLGDQTHRYGFQLLPGVIGTAIVSVIMLLLTHAKIMKISSACDKSLILADKPYLIQFLVFMVLSFAVASLFHYHLNKPLKRKSSSKAGMLCTECKLFQSILMIMKNSFHASFMLVVLLCGLADGAKTSFAYTFIADLGTAKGRNHILPLITATHFISHIVFLTLSPYLIKRFGHIQLVASGIFVYALSFIVYAMINDPIWVFVVEPLDGIARQLAKVAIITYVGSPTGIGAALQGFTHSIYLGMGTSIGTLICGFLVHKYGYILVFSIMGVTCLIGFAFILAADHYWPAEKTIGDSFVTYSMVVSSDSESDFDFLLKDIGSDLQDGKANNDSSFDDGTEINENTQISSEKN